MYIYNLKRQINECFLFANETIWLIDFATGNVLYLGSVVAIYFEVINFLATLAADFNELLLALDAEESTAYKVGCDACCRGASKRVENPSVLVGRCENDAGEQGEGLLRGMLAAGPYIFGQALQVFQIENQSRLCVFTLWLYLCFCADAGIIRLCKFYGDAGNLS